MLITKEDIKEIVKECLSEIDIVTMMRMNPLSELPISRKDGQVIYLSNDYLPRGMYIYDKVENNWTLIGG